MLQKIHLLFHSNYFIVLEKNHNYAYQNHNSCPRFLRFFAQSMSIGNSSSKLNFCQMHLVYLPKPGPKSKPDLVVEFFNVFLLKSTVLNLISLCLIKNQVLRIAFTKKCLPQPLASNFGKTQGFFFLRKKIFFRDSRYCQLETALVVEKIQKKP